MIRQAVFQPKLTTKAFMLFLILCSFACKSDKGEAPEVEEKAPSTAMVFDAEKWKTKDGKNYPYREAMLDDVVHNDSLRALKMEEILTLLGKPTRTNENYFYYQISQTSIGLWTLKTKTMVIKFKDDNSIEWIKIHG